jgi:glycosyltransferase involved in cell wall biosynthesis
MNLKVSLILSTYGRYVEVDDFLKSLLEQDCSREDFEVIVIDQNDVINLEPLIRKFENEFSILHYKTNVKGLSKAKNKGIELAKADIITFPDDDCTFYPDTISKAILFFSLNPKADLVYGCVFDNKINRTSIRKNSKNQKKLNLLNYSLNYSAIACFTKLKIKFDENFGVGSKIWLGEELDYIIRSILGGNNVYYSPLINVWHPPINVASMNEIKVYNYAYGYGAIMRKNLSFVLFLVFFVFFSYSVFRYVFNVFSVNRKKYFLAVSGRLDGFLKKDLLYR